MTSIPHNLFLIQKGSPLNSRLIETYGKLELSVWGTQLISWSGSVFWFGLDKCQVPSKTALTPPPQLDRGEEI